MQRFLKVKVPEETSIVVCGDIHGQLLLFEKLIKLINPGPKTWLVSVGDVYDKGDGRASENKIIDYFINFNSAGYGYIVNGNHELKYHKRYSKTGYEEKQLKWLENQPLVITFEWENTKCTVLHAGVLPYHTYENIGSNDDVCYVRDVDEEGNYIPLIWVNDKQTGEKVLVKKKEGRLWHELYDGRFGYILSGHIQQSDGIAKFYKNSANIDSAAYMTGILTAQVFDKTGLGDTFRIKIPKAN